MTFVLQLRIPCAWKCGNNKSVFVIQWHLHVIEMNYENCSLNLRRSWVLIYNSLVTKNYININIVPELRSILEIFLSRYLPPMLFRWNTRFITIFLVIIGVSMLFNKTECKFLLVELEEVTSGQYIRSNIISDKSKNQNWLRDIH